MLEFFISVCLSILFKGGGKTDDISIDNLTNSVKTDTLRFQQKAYKFN